MATNQYAKPDDHVHTSAPVDLLRSGLFASTGSKIVTVLRREGRVSTWR